MSLQIFTTVIIYCLNDLVDKLLKQNISMYWSLKYRKIRLKSKFRIFSQDLTYLAISYIFSQRQTYVCPFGKIT